MHEVVYAVVGVAFLRVTAGGVVAARRSNEDNIARRKSRRTRRAQAELLDKDPRQWIAEAEEDFEAQQDYLAGQAETQRQRELNRIRKLGA